MNLRAYLLGIGTGLLLAAIIVNVLPGQSASNIPSDLGTAQNNQTLKQEPAESKEPDQALNNESPANTGVTDNSGIADNTGVADNPGVIEFVVLEGSTATDIAAELLALGLIESETTFLQRVEELGAAANFQAGTFEITKGMSLDEIIAELTNLGTPQA